MLYVKWIQKVPWNTFHNLWRITQKPTTQWQQYNTAMIWHLILMWIRRFWNSTGNYVTIQNNLLIVPPLKLRIIKNISLNMVYFSMVLARKWSVNNLLQLLRECFNIQRTYRFLWIGILKKYRIKIWREIIISANTNTDNVINQMKDWKSKVLNCERSNKVDN